MNKPFVFGTPVEESNFIGRENEIVRLTANFSHGINTILMSPRRLGKTSIVKLVSKRVANSHIKVIHIDAFSCRDEYDFYNKFAENILKQTESKFEEWKNLVSDFITRLSPKISYSLDPNNEYSVSLGITAKTHTPEEILNLPQLIAQKQNVHLIVCIDEFQQIGEFTDSITVQKRMRGVWQHQKDVSYCLYGSKKHMMEKIFLKTSYPFYKFGDIVPILPIPTQTWIPYIQRGFESEGKVISEEMVDNLCTRVRNHSSYVQQLAWLTLLRTTKEVGIENLDLAFQDVMDENSSLFTAQTENLTTYQFNFLRALLAGVHKDFGIAEIRNEFNLGSYSNINRIKQSLIEKELIHSEKDGLLYISDPVLEIWLRRYIS